MSFLPHEPSKLLNVELNSKIVRRKPAGGTGRAAEELAVTMKVRVEPRAVLLREKQLSGAIYISGLASISNEPRDTRHETMRATIAARVALSSLLLPPSTSTERHLLAPISMHF
jgi:hypothetical protein